MSENLTIESPDFDYIRKETGLITEGAIHLLWVTLNEEIRLRRIKVNDAVNTLEGLTTADTSTAQEDNLDSLNSTIWWYNTASSFNLTGLRNGQSGRILFIHNVGSGTITLKHLSASSDVTNRISTQSAGDVTLSTGKSVVLMYINSLWREMKLA